MAFRLKEQLVAVLLAKLGAKVMVNDLKNAKSVMDEIRAAGGHAEACEIPVERGDAVVKAVVDTFGRIDIVSQLVCGPSLLTLPADHQQCRYWRRRCLWRDDRHNVAPND